MTVLVVTAWLALQIPAGILIGRLLQRQVFQAGLVPVSLRRQPRR